MVDAVIFDMDGLMLDTQKVWDRVVMENAAATGHEIKPGFMDAIRGSSREAVISILKEYFGDDCDPIELVKQVWARVDVAFEEGIDKKPGLDELLAWLKEHNIPMAVASGSKMGHIEHHLRVTGLEDVFAVKVTAEDAPHAKPAPDVFLITAEKLGVEPSRTLVLEDSGNGIRAAAAGGFIPVMVPDVELPTDELRELAFAVCDTLSDVIPLLEGGEL